MFPTFWISGHQPTGFTRNPAGCWPHRATTSDLLNLDAAITTLHDGITSYSSPSFWSVLTERLTPVFLMVKPVFNLLVLNVGNDPIHNNCHHHPIPPLGTSHVQLDNTVGCCWCPPLCVRNPGAWGVRKITKIRVSSFKVGLKLD